MGMRNASTHGAHETHMIYGWVIIQASSTKPSRRRRRERTAQSRECKLMHTMPRPAECIPMCVTDGDWEEASRI